MSTRELFSASRAGPNLPVLAARAILHAYRLIVSPVVGPTCRFAPSCSVYADAAMARYGLVRGGWMALRRIARCHPFHPGGWDPIV